jgi:glucose/arabinose dehydrogenase
MILVRVVAILAITFFSGSSFAQLYATPGNNNLGDTNLYIIDPDDGSIVQTVGPTGHYITGLDFHPVTGELYGTTCYMKMSPIQVH